MVAQTQVETDITYVISDLNNRVRNLENRHDLFGERLLVVNQNMIEEYKDLTKDIQLLNEEMKELKKDMFQMRDIIGNLVKEMGAFAKKDQVKVLEKYIDLWNPLGFVTRDELEKIMAAKPKARSVTKRAK